MSRRRDDDPAAVEFVDTAGPAAAGAGDEITTPPANRARWYLALSTAVLVVAALIAGKVRDGDRATPGPSASAPTSAASSNPQPDVDPAQCPGPTPCAASPGVPLAVGSALIEAFPGLRLGDGSTVYLRTGGLWFREVKARAGMLSILVRVQRPEQGTPMMQSGYDDGVAFVRQLEHGFLIQVQVEGPRNQLPSITNLYGLAADQRLLDLG